MNSDSDKALSNSSEQQPQQVEQEDEEDVETSSMTTQFSDSLDRYAQMADVCDIPASAPRNRPQNRTSRTSRRHSEPAAITTSDLVLTSAEVPTSNNSTASADRRRITNHVTLEMLRHNDRTAARDSRMYRYEVTTPNESEEQVVLVDNESATATSANITYTSAADKPRERGFSLFSERVEQWEAVMEQARIEYEQSVVESYAYHRIIIQNMAIFKQEILEIWDNMMPHEKSKYETKAYATLSRGTNDK